MRCTALSRPAISARCSTLTGISSAHPISTRLSLRPKIIIGTRSISATSITISRFDLTAQGLLPDWLIPTLSTDYVAEFFADKPQQRIAFINQIARWNMSSILHGEQGALNLSASLCHVLADPAAQEFAANQCREEARHVTAVAKYIKTRWGSPLPCGPTLADLLNEIVHAPEVYKKIVGMQIVVEGLAMGAFATIHKEWTDPVVKRLTQLIMTDEAFHHKFGKVWADRTMPQLDTEEQALVEDWAARCFQTLLFNLMAPSQMRAIYESFGMDADEVIAAFQAFMTDGERRKLLARSTNLFRSLVKTLLALRHHHGAHQAAVCALCRFQRIRRRKRRDGWRRHRRRRLGLPPQRQSRGRRPKPRGGVAEATD